MLTTKFKNAENYAVSVLKWIVFALSVGIVGGFAGAFFHHCSDFAAQTREKFPFLLFALPVAGVVIVFLYHIAKMDNDRGTNAIVEAVRSGEKIPLLVAPLIIVCTSLTHLCGGSSGREGAALQIGGSIGSFFARTLKLNKHNACAAVVCGMSALFSAVFGTPLTAAVFAVEVSCIGAMQYSVLFASVLSAITAGYTARLCGVHPTSFTLAFVPDFDCTTLLKVLLLGVAAGILSIVFVKVMHTSAHLFAKLLPNKYLRIVAGAFIVVALTLIVNSPDYNGTGMSVIVKVFETGQTASAAFVLKLLFTAITLSSGFKGGEIVPVFFVGSTFGALTAPLLQLDPTFAAATALTALFCGCVNCPLASIMLSIELFGAEGILYFAVASSVSYIVSGYYSLYSTQEFKYSKTEFNSPKTN